MRAAHISILVALAAPQAAAAATPAVPQPVLPAAYEGVTAAPSTQALDQWWRLFDDPALNALESEALRAGPDALTAGARLIEARETRRAQTAQTFPSGSISGNVSRQQAYAIGSPPDAFTPVGGVTDTVNGAFNVSWELDLFGRLATARRIAAADAAQATFDVEGVRASLAAAVADAYFQAKGLVIQLGDARETVRIEGELLDIARRKADVGAGPPDAADRVAGDLAQARAQADDLEAQLQSVRRQLLVLVGRGLAPSTDLQIDGAPPAAPPTPSALPAELLSRRPDVREAEFRLRSQIGAAHLAHLAIWPTITLLPGLGLNRTTAPGVSFLPPSTVATTQQTTAQGFWSLAAGVTIPTLDIPRLLDQARASDARTRQAAVAYEKTVQSAYAEAQSALTSLDAGRRAASELAQGEVRARRAYDAARRRYAEGADDITAALTAEQSWRAVRSALTSEQVQTLRRAVQTYKALGGGWAYSNPAGA